MVLEDVFQSKKPKDSPSSAKRAKDFDPFEQLARPMDRAAAALADFMLILPVFTIALFPVKKALILAEIQGDGFGLVWGWSAFVLVAALTYGLYQALFLTWKGATPGKMFLGLRVVNLWTGEKPNVDQAFWRGFIWMAEGFLAGLPWLGISTDKRRRPFHDRIADTIVTSETRPGQAPDHHEMFMAASMRFGGLLALAALVLMFMVSMRESGKDQNMARTDTAESFLCGLVGSTHRTWSDQNSVPSRVELALAMHVAGRIDDQCLQTEARQSLNAGRNETQAYLAMALASRNDPEKFKAYKSKVCADKAAGTACKVTDFLAQDMTDEQATQALTLLKDLDENSPLFLRLWAMKYWSVNQVYKTALSLANEVPPHPTFGEFYSSTRVKALWALNRKDEARSIAQATIENQAIEVHLDLARWLCYQETAACETKTSYACEALDLAATHSTDIANEPDFAIALITARACAQDDSLSELKNRVHNPNISRLLLAVEEAKSGRNQMAIEMLRTLLKDSEKDSPLYFEVQRRLIGLLSTSKDLLVASEEWMAQTPNDEGWLLVGRELIRKLEEAGEIDETMKTGQRLLTYDRYNVEIAQNLVIAAFKAGQINEAKKFLGFVPSGQEIRQERLPASDSEFQKTSKRLRALMGER